MNRRQHSIQNPQGLHGAALDQTTPALYFGGSVATVEGEAFRIQESVGEAAAAS